MKKLCAVALSVLVASGVFAAGAYAASPEGAEAFAFGAKRGEYFDLHGGKVKLRFYGTHDATPFTVSPLRRDGRNIGPKGIAAVAKTDSVLTIELHDGRPEADSIAVRIGSVRAHGGRLIVSGHRVRQGRVRATLQNTDGRLPKLMRHAILTLDVNPSGAAVEGPDGKRFDNPSIGFVTIPGGNAAGASRIALSHFVNGNGQSEVAHPETIFWQYIEKTSFECSLYGGEPNPMSATIVSNLEGRTIQNGEGEVIDGTKPLHFSGPTYGQVIPVDEKTSTGYAAHISVSTQFPTSVFGAFQIVPEAGEGNSGYATMAIACEGNVEGHEPPPAPEPPAPTEHRRWKELVEIEPLGPPF